jgi:hypothetical protein
MTASIGLKDSKTGQTARVTRFGQLVVAPLDYSQPIKRELDTINTAFNFLSPEAGKNIVITDILVSANKDVSNVDPADIEIYGADGVDSLIPLPSVISPRLTRAANLALTGLNLLIPEGKWVNAKTNDNNILITLMFYRVPVEKV